MKEAEEYQHHVNVEQADWSAVDHLLAHAQHHAGDRCRTRSSCAAAANTRTATAACRSSAIRITSRGKLIELSGAGLAGIAVSLVNYADELPYFRAEVLPRLERAGLRLPA